METNLSLFNQINSLSYWFLLESNYKSSVILDAENLSQKPKIDKTCLFLCDLVCKSHNGIPKICNIALFITKFDIQSHHQHIKLSHIYAYYKNLLNFTKCHKSRFYHISTKLI